jgi:micrococcal nuclease
MRIVNEYEADGWSPGGACRLDIPMILAAEGGETSAAEPTLLMMSFRRVVILLAMAVAAGAFGANRLRAAPDEPAGSSQLATVTRVVDGDTVVASIGGRSERVRYIGMDTPEDVKPGTPVQCYSRAAAAENRRLVAGRRVRLVVDAEARDRYGRLLAYVYRSRDHLFVNARLVRGGYAVPLTIPPNVAHAEHFRTLAAVARRKGRGLWSACRSS